MVPLNRIGHIGRKKKGYRAPEGLVRMPGSPYWWIVIGKIRKSTKIPLSDITKATILLREVQKRLLEKRAGLKKFWENLFLFLN